MVDWKQLLRERLNGWFEAVCCAAGLAVGDDASGNNYCPYGCQVLVVSNLHALEV